MTNKTTLSGLSDVYFSRFENEVSEISTPDLLIPNGLEYMILHSRNIIYISKNGNKCALFCSNGLRHEINTSIKEIWKKLSYREHFIRLSNSLIVNENHVVTINRRTNKHIILSNGEELQVDEEHIANMIHNHITL